MNVGCGPAEERVLLTGLHAVADIYCENCKTTLGWKYVRDWLQIAFPLVSRGAPLLCPCVLCMILRFLPDSRRTNHALPQVQTAGLLLLNIFGLDSGGLSGLWSPSIYDNYSARVLACTQPECYLRGSAVIKCQAIFTRVALVIV